MNQTPSHSQMPTFVKNESNTKPVLRQHPKPEEMRTSFWAKTKAVIKEVVAIVVVVATIGSVTLMVHSCSDDVERQHAQAVKHQLQFSESNEGNR